MTAVSSTPTNFVAVPVSVPPVPAAPEHAPPGAGTPSLRRNFSWTLAGNVVYAACQWGILVVLAKLLTPEMVGQFVLGMAVSAPVFLLASLNLGSVQATDAKRTTSTQTFLRLRVLTTVLAILALAGIVLASGFPARTAVVVLIVGAAKAMDALSDIFHSFYQQRERMRHVSVSLVINGVASVAAAAVAVWLTRDVVWAAAGFALGSAVSLLAYNVPTASTLWRSASDGGSLWRSTFLGPWEVGVLGRLAWVAAPVGIAAGLVSVNGQLPRYFIHHHYGDGPLGVFAAMAYVMVAGVTFVGSLCNAAVPRLARHYSEGDYAGFRRVGLKITAVAAAVGLAGVLAAVVAGRPLLLLLYGPEYAAESGVFAWIMAAAAVGYVASALGYLVTATRSFRMLTVPYAGVTAVTLAACWLLVGRYGLTGAAWAVGISSAAGCLAPMLILLRLRGRAAAARAKGPEAMP